MMSSDRHEPPAVSDQEQAAIRYLVRLLDEASKRLPGVRDQFSRSTPPIAQLRGAIGDLAVLSQFLANRVGEVGRKCDAEERELLAEDLAAAMAPLRGQLGKLRGRR